MARLPRFDFPGIAQHVVQRGNDRQACFGRHYVGSFNARYRRTGTLWEGRFKAALVDTDRYLLTCYRYIELNPVRARMVESPGEYRWSSHSCNALGAHEARITPHECYLALGVEAATRQRAYRDLFDQPPPLDQLAELRVHTQQQRAVGSAWFRAPIEALANRPVAVKPRGRP